MYTTMKLLVVFFFFFSHFAVNGVDIPASVVFAKYCLEYPNDPDCSKGNVQYEVNSFGVSEQFVRRRLSESQKWQKVYDQLSERRRMAATTPKKREVCITYDRTNNNKCVPPPPVDSTITTSYNGFKTACVDPVKETYRSSARIIVSQDLENEAWERFANRPKVFQDREDFYLSKDGVPGISLPDDIGRLRYGSRKQFADFLGADLAQLETTADWQAAVTQAGMSKYICFKVFEDLGKNTGCPQFSRDKYSDYDQMLLTAENLIVSSKTKFFHNRNQYNGMMCNAQFCGEGTDKGIFIKDGYVIGVVGARLDERYGLMEQKTMTKPGPTPPSNANYVYPCYGGTILEKDPVYLNLDKLRESLIKRIRLVVAEVISRMEDNENTQQAVIVWFPAGLGAWGLGCKYKAGQLLNRENQTEGAKPGKISQEYMHLEAFKTVLNEHSGPALNKIKKVMFAGFLGIKDEDYSQAKIKRLRGATVVDLNLIGPLQFAPRDQPKAEWLFTNDNWATMGIESSDAVYEAAEFTAAVARQRKQIFEKNYVLFHTFPWDSNAWVGNEFWMVETCGNVAKDDPELDWKQIWCSAGSEKPSINEGASRFFTASGDPAAVCSSVIIDTLNPVENKEKLMNNIFVLRGTKLFRKIRLP